MGRSALRKHRNIMDSSLSLLLKMKVFSKWVLPVLMYGAETWRFLRELVSQLRRHKRECGEKCWVNHKDRKRTSQTDREQANIDDFKATKTLGLGKSCHMKNK